MTCRIQTLKVTREETVDIGQEVSSLLVALFVKNAEYSPVNQTHRLAALYCTEGAESFLACDAWFLCWGFIVLSTFLGRFFGCDSWSLWVTRLVKVQNFRCRHSGLGSQAFEVIMY